MKIELTQTPLLSPQQICEIASSLDALHTRVLKTIERLQKDVDARKTQIANRWKSAGISDSDKSRLLQQEVMVAVREIKDASEAELLRFFKEAGPAHAKLIEQKPYYDSPVKVLARFGLGQPERSAYLEQLAYAGPGELGHMAQVAVGTKNLTLGAALVSILDSRSTKDRPLSASSLANALNLEEFVKVQEYFKIGDARLQGIVLAVRTWQQGKSNPLNTVSLALLNREIDDTVLDGYE